MYVLQCTGQRAYFLYIELTLGPQVDEYEKALHDMHSGDTIKPILLFE